MNAADRARLTAALRDQVARIAADLRGSLLGPARPQAERLHAQEQVGEAFEVWTDLLSRRAAVLWVLKSVYVRVLEDRGLLAPGRLRNPEAQQLFEALAPNLGESAFLRWVYRDLASRDGGLPELFSPQPAEIVAPADALSRDLIAFWRHRDPDTGACFDFSQERFEGELMGDLYQELDPVVKARFALCQTPGFVRAFILGRTLTPAIETYGADTVRLLDPACGSGHFLIDALKRLVAATAAQHPGWDRPTLVRHCLARVVGIDLNDYACALARARLVMTAAELALHPPSPPRAERAGVRGAQPSAATPTAVATLAEAAAFHPQVYWADGLEQVERGRDSRGQQLDLLDPEKNQAPRASLTRPEVRAALRGVLGPRFHAVVANPPYITEGDEARRAYHREPVGRGRRYVSAHRQYSLAAPFTERCFQLAVPGGYVGLIVSNNFMKREFGKPLIEQVLAGLDLTLVADSSQAYIPFHGTPTVLLFGRNRAPGTGPVRAVMGKRGESGTPEDPALGQVWSGIAQGWDQVGYETEYVSVADLPRETLGRHPWSLGGGGAAELKELIQSKAERTLGAVAEIGTGAVTREDQVFLVGQGPGLRLDIPREQMRPLVEGDVVRDWCLTDPTEAIWPYNPDTLGTAEGAAAEAVKLALWPWRTRLAGRVAYGKSQMEHGLEFVGSAVRTFGGRPRCLFAGLDRRPDQGSVRTADPTPGVGLKPDLHADAAQLGPHDGLGLGRHRQGLEAAAEVGPVVGQGAGGALEGGGDRRAIGPGGDLQCLGRDGSPVGRHHEQVQGIAGEGATVGPAVAVGQELLGEQVGAAEDRYGQGGDRLAADRDAPFADHLEPDRDALDLDQGADAIAVCPHLAQESRRDPEQVPEGALTHRGADGPVPRGRGAQEIDVHGLAVLAQLQGKAGPAREAAVGGAQEPRGHVAQDRVDAPVVGPLKHGARPGHRSAPGARSGPAPPGRAGPGPGAATPARRGRGPRARRCAPGAVARPGSAGRASGRSRGWGSPWADVSAVAGGRPSPCLPGEGPVVRRVRCADLWGPAAMLACRPGPRSRPGLGPHSGPYGLRRHRVLPEVLGHLEASMDHNATLGELLAG